MAKAKKPVISVIVQTKKTPLMILKRCIQCIKEQTLSDIEILLLDSNDADSKYKGAIHEDKDFFSDLIYLEIPEDGEFINGKNAALKIYRGDYITFISAQDTMPPTRLEEMIAFFAQNRSCNVVYSDMAATQNNTLESGENGQASHKLKYLSQIVFHRDCFQWIGEFDQNLVAHCDDDVLFRLHSLKLVHHISSPETTISLCPSCYNGFTPLNSAIGCRQLGIKYNSLFRKNKKEKKQLYYKIAEEYKKAGVFHRFIQFQTKAFFIRQK